MKKFSKNALAMASVLFVAPSLVHAGIAFNGWERDSRVTDSVTDSAGTFSYEYTVINTSFRCNVNPTNPECENEFDGEVFAEPIIIDWELPYFDDAAISNIRSPVGWTYSIETIGVPNFATGWAGVAEWQTPGDPFNNLGDAFNNVEKVLHWYVENTDACFPGGDIALSSVSADPACAGIISDASRLDPSNYHQDRLSGFGFDSIYDKTDAPYQASWLLLPVRTGDPAFPLGGFPNSPTVAGTQQVPLPAPLALLGLGILGLAYSRKFK